MPHRYEVQKRTRKATKDMILTMARHGDHYWYQRWRQSFDTERDVELALKQVGTTLAEVVDTCRDKNARRNPFDNLLSSTTWSVTLGPGDVVGYTDSEGNEVVVFEGESGTFAEATSIALFGKAVEDFERSIGEMSYVEFLSCLANGIASVEAYILGKVGQHNRRNPGAELVDDKDNKVPFERKIKAWVPTMAGKRLDLSGQNWRHFRRLKEARDTEHTHSKNPTLQTTYPNLCKQLNLFRSGIASFLLDLHVVFGDRVPSKISKYAYHPDIKLVTELEEAG